MPRTVITRAVTALLLAAAALSHAPPTDAGGPPYLVASEFSPGSSWLTDLVVDASGNAFVSGIVTSYNFEGVNSAVYTNAGFGQRFVAKYAPLAIAPSFVAIVGRPTSRTGLPWRDLDEDQAVGLALDASGNAYLVAYDGEKTYPVDGGTYVASTGKKYVYKVSPGGAVSKLSAALDPAINRVGAIAVDAAGAIWLTGSARDGLNTTAGAPYPAPGVAPGCIAPYVTKLGPSGQDVLFATYLGTSRNVPGDVCGGSPPGYAPHVDPVSMHPTGFAMAIDSSGFVYVAGQAEPGLPATAGALDRGTKVPGPASFNNLVSDPALHAFVVKLAAGGSIVYSARVGGSFRDRATSLLVAPSGAVVIAGKTSSPDFPRTGATALGGFPLVLTDCLLWTPEVGFLTALSPDATQLLFSGYLALGGGQLDDCGGFGTFNPARLATDGSGNLYVAGFTSPDNRYFRASAGAIVPDQSAWGGQLLQIYSGDGRQLVYSSALGQDGVSGIGVDALGTLIVASFDRLQRIAPGLLPVAMTAPSSRLCAGKPFTLSASVAVSGDNGTVDFSSDGTSLGEAPLANGVATQTVTVGAAGIRNLKATYHGTGVFDGYASPDRYVAINQAGACP
ncbi:MAG TPA: Ig-like domain repeat protein [Casimicrobiaceae bacterium]|nr:Ig-like domain repeat protein [Casimicrobiaceae bacterium]